MTGTPTPPACHEPAIYTLDDAVRALPLIRAIAQDAHAAYARLRDGLAALSGLKALDELTSDQSLPREVRQDLARLRDYVLELEELGARIEDPELGLVSVGGVRDGASVRYCWKIGEDTFGHWYPADADYEDRLPIG